MRTLIAVLAAMAISLGSASMAMAGDSSARRTISVAASGTVIAVPDMAVISVGVVTEAKTASEALAQNGMAMRKVIDGLKAAGIEPRDLVTTQVDLSSRYEQRKSASSSWSQLSGYTATNMLRVRVRDLKAFGTILDKAVSLGANRFGGISFVVSDAEVRKDDARAKAVAKARARAQLYAKSAGVKLAEVISINETSHTSPGSRMMESRKVSASPVPIESGEQEISVRVEMVFAID